MIPLVSAPMSDRAKFDLDLQYGQQGENWLRWLGTDQAKVEVKTERDAWATTGNAVFEFKCRGKPSGIAITTSDYWVHIFKLGDATVLALVIPTLDLREYLREAYKRPESINARITHGGDDNAAEVILVPIPELMKMAFRTLPFTMQGKVGW